MLSDLSFSDLLLRGAGAGTDGAELIVLGQIRPTTWATLLRVDLVGQVVESADWPVVDRGHRTGKVVVGPGRDPRARPGAASAPVDRTRATPARCPPSPTRHSSNASPCATGEIPSPSSSGSAPLEDRRPGRLERVYRDLYRRLAAMVAAGDFPFVGEDVTTEDSPRVGDGLVLVEPEGSSATRRPTP